MRFVNAVIAFVIWGYILINVGAQTSITDEVLLISLSIVVAGALAGGN